MSQPTTTYVLALANRFGESPIILGSVAKITIVQQAKRLCIILYLSDLDRFRVPVTGMAKAPLLAWVMLLG